MGTLFIFFVLYFPFCLKFDFSCFVRSQAETTVSDTQVMSKTGDSDEEDQLPPTATITVVGWWAAAVILACVINVRGSFFRPTTPAAGFSDYSASPGGKMFISSAEFDWNKNTSGSKRSKSPG